METKHKLVLAVTLLVTGGIWLYLQVIEPRRLEKECVAGMLAPNRTIEVINEGVRLCIKVGGMDNFRQALQANTPPPEQYATDAAIPTDAATSEGAADAAVDNAVSSTVEAGIEEEGPSN